MKKSELKRPREGLLEQLATPPWTSGRADSNRAAAAKRECRSFARKRPCEGLEAQNSTVKALEALNRPAIGKVGFRQYVACESSLKLPRNE